LGRTNNLSPSLLRQLMPELKMDAPQLVIDDFGTQEQLLDDVAEDPLRLSLIEPVERLARCAELLEQLGQGLGSE
jgi:EAL domain-containing protein (putative c-di-GMP-specific phosphodiesterase class I)